MKMQNLNSTIKITPQQETEVVSHLGFLFSPWNRVPIFLVDEALMDIFFPPERLIYLNPECVEQHLKGIAAVFEDIKKGDEIPYESV